MENSLKQFIFDHFSSRCSSMQSDEISDCKGLVGPNLWHQIVLSERRYDFERLLPWLVEKRLIPLEYVGFNYIGDKLYRKISI